MMLVRPHRNHVLYPLMTSIDTTLRHNTYTAYSVPHLLITHDYVITKLVCKYMRHGRKSIAMKLFMRAITELKAMFGFQPPFAYKQSSLGMRQIFKIYQVLLRKTKVIHTPGMSRGHNQISYALNHLVWCAKQIQLSENLNPATSLSVVPANCFISTPGTGAIDNIK